MVNLLDKLIEIRELEISVLKILKEINKEHRVNKLLDALKLCYPISNITLKNLAKILDYDYKKMKDAYNLFKNNGDYIASFFDEEDGI